MNDETLQVTGASMDALDALATVAISVVLLGLLVEGHRRLRKAVPPPPIWLPQLAFLALATFLLCTLVVPALVVKLSGAGDAPSPALGILATALANVVGIAVTLLVARRRFDATPGELALGRPSLLSLAFAALAIAAALPAFVGVSALNLRLVDALGLEKNQALVQTLLDDRSFLENPWVLASIVLVVPFCEEVLFRGLLQRALRVVLRPVAAIASSSLLFAVVHDPQSILPVFTIGVVLGLVIERTGSVGAASAAHALFNAFNLALMAGERTG